MIPAEGAIDAEFNSRYAPRNNYTKNNVDNSTNLQRSQLYFYMLAHQHVLQHGAAV